MFPVGNYVILLCSRYPTPKHYPAVFEICYFFCFHTMSVLKNFLIFSPFREYLRGDHYTSFRFTLEHERICRTLHSSRKDLKNAAGFDYALAHHTQRSSW